MNDKLISYLIEKGKEVKLSAVEYARKFYKKADFIKWSQKSYFKEYYQANKERYKERAERNRGKFVYFLTDENDNILYIGSTVNLKNRISWHKYHGRQFSKVFYDDYTDTDLDMDEVREIEYWEQEIHKNTLKDCEVYSYNKDTIIDILSRSKNAVFGLKVGAQMVRVSIRFNNKQCTSFKCEDTNIEDVIDTILKELKKKRRDIKEIVISKIEGQFMAYKCKRKRTIFNLINLGAKVLDIEVENVEGQRRFIFVFSTETEEDNKKIDLAKANELDMSNEDFTYCQDIFWNLIREKYPKSPQKKKR